MRPGARRQVRFDQDDHIQWAGEIGVQQLGLINTCLDTFLNRQGYQVPFWHVLVINPFTIFRMRTAAFVFSTEGKTERRVLAQFGNELEAALLHHPKSRVVAKMIIQRQVDGLKNGTDE
jgi:hypothetical protein